VGRRFRRGDSGAWVRVIGVAEDQRGVYMNWTGTTLEPRQLIYVADAQVAAQQMHLLVRAHQVTPGLAHDVRQSVERVDPTQSVTRVRLLADQFAIPRVERQWIALILGSGAAVAVLLAMIGVFGLVSYYTAARLPELALRVALGAPARTLAWLVARGTLRSVAIGVAVASLLLWIVQRFVQRFAYETSALSPTVLAAVALLVATVATVALVVPLRRVRRLSPQELLRAD
jgi:predicted lysophospholipase L1 biosynthesis ABC-type transport system permease subunit